MRSRSRLTLTLSTIAATAAAASPAAAAQPWQTAARLTSIAAAPAPATLPVVCVIDSGVRITPSLEGRVIQRTALQDGVDVDDAAINPSDRASGHGTLVAETIAATWPHARIVSVRVADASGLLDPAYYAQAIADCRQAGASVINLSLSSNEGSEQITSRIRQAVGAAASGGVDTVVAAGNAPGAPRYPASALGDIATVVSARDNAGAACDFSASGAAVLLGAPGCPVVLPSAIDGAPVEIFGTSVSAPQVAGVLAAAHGYAPGQSTTQRRSALTGLAGGMLDGDEVLRRIGRADLAPAPGTATPGPGSVSTQPPPTPSPTPSTTPTAKPTATRPTARKPSFRVLWRSGRLRVSVRNAPKGARLRVTTTTPKRTVLRSKTTVLTLPKRYSRSRARLVLRLETTKGKRLSSSTIRAPKAPRR